MKRVRPRIAFFDYLDVFEDFYPQYGISQETFATKWAESGNHAFLQLAQEEVGDVTWYAFSLKPQLSRAHHEVLDCQIRILRSSFLHRWLWRWFYLPKIAWRWRAAYPAYALPASYLSMLSFDLFRAIREDRPDFIFVQDYATGRFDTLLMIASILRVPLIAYHSGSRPQGYVGKLAKHWTIRRADRLIVSSHRECEMLAEQYGVSRERMRVILTPIQTNIFQPSDRAAACRALDLDPARRYLLFVGRLQDPVKRVSSLIRAFAAVAPEHPDVDFLIVGNGPDEEDLEAMAAEAAPGRVRFLGWISGDERKASLYNSAECLLLASRSEGFPTVVGEAMACGTPVLASDVGGISELVSDGISGWLFQAGDDEGLLRRLSEVLRCPQKIASMRPRVRSIAEDRVSPRAVGAALRECFLRETCA